MFPFGTGTIITVPCALQQLLTDSQIPLQVPVLLNLIKMLEQIRRYHGTACGQSPQNRFKIIRGRKTVWGLVSEESLEQKRSESK